MTLPRPGTLAVIRIAREAALLVRRAARPRRVRLKSSTADVLTATDVRVEALVAGGWPCCTQTT